VLHRTSFEGLTASSSRLPALLEKLRGAPPPVKAVVLAVSTRAARGI